MVRPLYFTDDEKHEVRKKIIFQCCFIVQNPILPLERPFNDFKFFNFFFKKLIFFSVLTPYTAQVRKVKSAKNHFLVLFYSAKSISDHFTISETFQVFFSKNQFFSLLQTLYCKGEKHEVRKKIVLVLFYSAKSNSDHVTNSDFSRFFFGKVNFSTVSTPILHKWEKWS